MLQHCAWIRISAELSRAAQATLFVSGAPTAVINITGDHSYSSRTYGTHKKLPVYISLFSLFNNNIWSYLLWSPVILIVAFAVHTSRAVRSFDCAQCLHTIARIQLKPARTPNPKRGACPIAPPSSRYHCCCCCFNLTLLEPQSRFGDKLLRI